MSDPLHEITIPDIESTELTPQQIAKHIADQLEGLNLEGDVLYETLLHTFRYLQEEMEFPDNILGVVKIQIRALHQWSGGTFKEARQVCRIKIEG
jgi:hypothetical protein